MSKKTEADMTQLSAGQQKKLERKKELASAKKNKIVANICWYVFVGILAAAICVGAGVLIYRQVTRVAMVKDYSAGIDEKGLLKGVKASDIVTMDNYKGVSVPYSEIKLSDEELQSKVEALIKPYLEASTTLERAAENGDMVNIDYAGSIDGTAFDGGTATAQDVRLGSKSMIDGFEDQIVGHKIGEEFTIDVTFPTDYGKVGDPEAKIVLNGKKAQFKIKINSIKLVKIGDELVKSDFTDAFVAQYYKDKADSAEAYKDSLRKDAERDNLEDYVMNAILKSAKATEYPKSVIKTLKGKIKYADYSTYAMYSSYYQQMNQSAWESFEAYLSYCYGQTEAEYDAAIVETAKKNADQLLAIQAIAEKENLSANADQYKELLVSEGGDATVIEQNKAQYGLPYFMQQHLTALVTKFVADAAVVDYEK